MLVLHYDSNNSGGDWWLKDKDWKGLEKCGWTVQWRDDCPDNRWLGALATAAWIEVSNEDTAADRRIREWQKVTGDIGTEMGCNCCGPPHSFNVSEHDEKDEEISRYNGAPVRYWTLSGGDYGTWD